MKCMVVIFATIFLTSCGASSSKPSSVELITRPSQQDSIFSALSSLVVIDSSAVQGDSLAFLILPLQASCPSCRKKTIDSIIAHKRNLTEGHFIILSANGGKKIMGSYFKEVKRTMPELPKQLFHDSINQADKLGLYDDNPTLYYALNKKVYKKVAAVPATVREDLREFFSGYRMDDSNK